MSQTPRDQQVRVTNEWVKIEDLIDILREHGYTTAPTESVQTVSVTKLVADVQLSAASFDIEKYIEVEMRNELISKLRDKFQTSREYSRDEGSLVHRMSLTIVDVPQSLTHQWV